MKKKIVFFCFLILDSQLNMGITNDALFHSTDNSIFNVDLQNK